jgi:ribokinase
MLELVAYTDHLIASESFAGQFAPGASRVEVLWELKKMGPELVTVTLGAEGSVSLWGDRPLRLPALPIEAVDTTGAGDVYHGAYIFGLLQGWPPPERIRWATVASGLNCLHLGGRTGLPSLVEVRKRTQDLEPFIPL